tara:strand:+ start:3004 stop:3246 length:243 start_codon:yes stop_codon:yes gene_type:complete
MSIGFWQIAIVVILIVLLFGRGKISDLMGDVAKGIKSFKKGMSENPSENPSKNPSENPSENPDANNKNSTTDDDNNSKQD